MYISGVCTKMLSSHPRVLFSIYFLIVSQLHDNPTKNSTKASAGEKLTHNCLKNSSNRMLFRREKKVVFTPIIHQSWLVKDWSGMKLDGSQMNFVTDFPEEATKVIIEKSCGMRFLWIRKWNFGWIWAKWPTFLPSWLQNLLTYETIIYLKCNDTICGTFGCIKMYEIIKKKTL